jgi:asparagine synthase (glutamine-hydrolysing)
MCGVVGFTGVGAARTERISAVRRGIRAIVHRGPEEVGIYDDRSFTLGTVRLSIVDPLLGKQPMATPDGRYILGFNGEIFNYVELRATLQAAGVRFVTRSDTEVLLHSLAHWGVTDALPRLNGQFGFAFYDVHTRELVLGRDPFGERPMYYSVVGSACYFASEIKGLFAFDLPRRMSPERTLAAARFWSPIPDETCFEGVHCLPQGHLLRVRDGAVRVHRHYHGLENGRDSRAEPDLTFAEAEEGVRETLRDSVRIRLRGDYPLGAFVSGGVDSAIVAATMRELLVEPLRTFAIAAENPGVDETAHQEVVTAAFGTHHTSVRVTGADVRQRFPKVIEQCEMPLHRTAPVACGMLAEAVGAAGVRIVLGGEGADEQFLGYDITKEASVLQRFVRGDGYAAAAREFGDTVRDLRHTTDTSGATIAAFYQARRSDPGLVFGAHLRRFEAEPLTELIPCGSGTAGADRRMYEWIRGQAPGFAGWNMVDRAQWLDIHTMFIGYGMTCHGDRPGTGCGVETRFPFLDPAVTAFAARLPHEWKLPDLSREKHVLRTAYAGRVPAGIIDRPKLGMRVAGASCLLPGPADDWVAEALSDSSLEASTVLDAAAARRLVDRVRRSGKGVRYPDTHAYLHVLSILLLEKTLVHGFRVPDVDIDRILLKQLDGEAQYDRAAS